MASDKRSEKLKRLVAVQRHMEKVAEGELAETGRQRAEVAETMDLVIQAISSGEQIHWQFARNYSGRFTRLMMQDKQLAGVQQVQEMKVLRERTKADRLADKMKEARTLEDREADDNAIYDLLEITLAGATPASSKLGNS